MYEFKLILLDCSEQVLKMSGDIFNFCNYLHHLASSYLHMYNNSFFIHGI
jgi:hypothetical protein